MTLVWGFGLVGRGALSLSPLVFTLSVHDYLIAGPILGYGVSGALGLWTFLYVRGKTAPGRRAASGRRGSGEGCGEPAALDIAVQRRLRASRNTRTPRWNVPATSRSSAMRIRLADGAEVWREMERHGDSVGRPAL